MRVRRRDRGVFDACYHTSDCNGYILFWVTPIPATPTRWTDSFMDALREQGDPVADQVVADLFAAGSVTAVNALMRTLAENDQPPADSLPQNVKDFLAASAALPPWADTDKIRKGEEVFWKYGPRA